ncbi:paral putative tRNA synthase [Escherichia coli]|uniref:Paral putative tRNA synthase n=1 Tax=Escherichia coli TaxID=562 RepID=A0A2X1NI41_ECOLX|nr:paral putative tRNA synthase [Escherichia coli]
MTDSYLPRLVEAQSTGRCGVVSAHVFEQGVDAVRQELARLQQEGYRYAVLDALTEHHLEIQGEALRDAPLVTGGSGLAIAWPGSGRKKTVTRLAKQGVRSLGAA